MGIFKQKFSLLLIAAILIAAPFIVNCDRGQQQAQSQIEPFGDLRLFQHHTHVDEQRDRQQDRHFGDAVKLDRNRLQIDALAREADHCARGDHGEQRRAEQREQQEQERGQHQQQRAGWHPKLLAWPLLKRLVADKVTARLGGQLRLTVSGGAPLSVTSFSCFFGPDFSRHVQVTRTARSAMSLFSLQVTFTLFSPGLVLGGLPVRPQSRSPPVGSIFSR